MADSSIENIKLGAKDRSGYDITCIYALNPPEYAVYGTEVRVSVQYADDKETARQQRAAMAACNPLRGQINGLIDGWRGDGRGSRGHRVIDYDRRVADALVMGLEGGVASALDLLTEIRNDIVAERRSLAQSDYLLTAVLAVAVLLVVNSAVRAFLIPEGTNEAWSAALTGASGGTLGAFFSIAVGLRSRTVLVDIQKWDNRRDALLRILVGTIGGAILICMFLTKLVSALTITNTTFTTDADGIGSLTALVVGFLAGFSERAVPDILSKASLATDAATGEGSSDVAADQARAAASSAESPPAVTPAVLVVDPATVDEQPANGENLPVENGSAAEAEPAAAGETELAEGSDAPPQAEAETGAGAGEADGVPSAQPADATDPPVGEPGEGGIDPETEVRAPQS
jgi:hypothetical protein